MNLRIFITFCTCCLFCLSIRAQDIGMVDIIVLNDGSTIKGEVLNETPETVEIKLTSGTLISLPTNSIEKIKQGKKNRTYFSDGKAKKNKGYFGVIKVGVLQPRTEDGFFDSWGSSVHTVHGYIFNKKLSAGIGLGKDNYLDFDFFPIYAQVRYETSNKKNRFYFSGDIGYGIAGDYFLDKIYSGGLMVQPTIGVQFSDQSGGGFFMEWGQKFQWAKRKVWWSEDAIDKLRLTRSAVTFGYRF